MRKVAFCAATTMVLMLMGLPAEAVPPANDSFASATLIGSLPFTDESTVTTDATTETDEPLTNSCVTGDPPTNDSVAKTVWYKFVLGASEVVNFALDTFGSVSTDDSYDTVVVLWKGTTLVGLEEVACSDDSGPDFGSHSRVGFPLKGAATFYIQVGSWTGEVDEVTIPPDTGTLHVHALNRKTRPGVVRGNVWFLNAGFDGVGDASFAYGNATDDPLIGTTTGDGISKPVVRRGNVWFANFWFDAFAEAAFAFGNVTDFPILGDWEGDTLATPGVVRGNRWFLVDSQTGETKTFLYGRATDYPIVGDWDGDGDETPGVVRGNVWYLNNNTDTTHDLSFAFGNATDFPVAGDWNGDGTARAGVVRGNVWYLNDNTDSTHDVTFAFGNATDFPIAGDWDGAVTGLGVGSASASGKASRKSPMPTSPFPWVA